MANSEVRRKMMPLDSPRPQAVVGGASMAGLRVR